jgi:hypothetical protein
VLGVERPTHSAYGYPSDSGQINVGDILHERLDTQESQGARD